MPSLLQSTGQFYCYGITKIQTPDLPMTERKLSIIMLHQESGLSFSKNPRHSVKRSASLLLGKVRLRDIDPRLCPLKAVRHLCYEYWNQSIIGFKVWAFHFEVHPQVIILHHRNTFVTKQTEWLSLCSFNYKVIFNSPYKRFSEMARDIRIHALKMKCIIIIKVSSGHTTPACMTTGPTTRCLY